MARFTMGVWEFLGIPCDFIGLFVQGTVQRYGITLISRQSLHECENHLTCGDYAMTWFGVFLQLLARLDTCEVVFMKSRVSGLDMEAMVSFVRVHSPLCCLRDRWR